MTVVHIVSKLQQQAILNDEWVAFCSRTLRENILIIFPRRIEIEGSLTNRALIFGFIPTAFTVSLGIPS